MDLPMMLPKKGNPSNGSVARSKIFTIPIMKNSMSSLLYICCVCRLFCLSVLACFRIFISLLTFIHDQELYFIRRRIESRKHCTRGFDFASFEPCFVRLSCLPACYLASKSSTGRSYRSSIYPIKCSHGCPLI